MSIGKKILGVLFNGKIIKIVSGLAATVIVSCLASLGILKQQQEVLVQESIKQAIELAIEEGKKAADIPEVDGVEIPEDVEMKTPEEHLERVKE